MRSEMSMVLFEQNKKKRHSSGNAAPFRRVSDVMEVDPRLQDNSFEAKVGGVNSRLIRGRAIVQLLC